MYPEGRVFVKFSVRCYTINNKPFSGDSALFDAPLFAFLPLFPFDVVPSDLTLLSPLAPASAFDLVLAALDLADFLLGAPAFPGLTSGSSSLESPEAATSAAGL